MSGGDQPAGGARELSAEEWTLVAGRRLRTVDAAPYLASLLLAMPVYAVDGPLASVDRSARLYLDIERFRQLDESEAVGLLLHEVGHAVGRHFDVVGHRENHYVGSWDRRARRLIGAVASGRHWSSHLNGIARALGHGGYAASEIWAELFMLFYLYPGLPETEIIEAEIDSLRGDPSFCRLEAGLSKVLGD